MDALNEKLSEYQHELGAVLARKRYFELQASEMGQRAAVIEARIAGIQEAAALFEVETAKSTAAPPKIRKRHRPLSEQWKAILLRASRAPEFNYDDLEAFAADIGHEVGRDTLRSQMSGYKALGLVEPVGEGKFTVTKSGLAAASLGGVDTAEVAPKGNDAPPGPPEEGDRDNDPGGILFGTVFGGVGANRSS